MELDKCSKMTQAEYDMKIRGKLGLDRGDDKSIPILDRCVEWAKNGILYDTDPRHVEIIVRELGIKDSNAVVSPRIKRPPVPDEDNKHMEPAQTKKFHQSVSRCNFLYQN